MQQTVRVILGVCMLTLLGGWSVPAEAEWGGQIIDGMHPYQLRIDPARVVKADMIVLGEVVRYETNMVDFRNNPLAGYAVIEVEESFQSGKSSKEIRVAYSVPMIPKKILDDDITTQQWLYEHAPRNLKKGKSQIFLLNYNRVAGKRLQPLELRLTQVHPLPAYDRIKALADRLAAVRWSKPVQGVSMGVWVETVAGDNEVPGVMVHLIFKNVSKKPITLPMVQHLPQVTAYMVDPAGKTHILNLYNGPWTNRFGTAENRGLRQNHFHTLQPGDIRMYGYHDDAFHWQPNVKGKHKLSIIYNPMVSMKRKTIGEFAEEHIVFDGQRPFKLPEPLLKDKLFTPTIEVEIDPKKIDAGNPMMYVEPRMIEQRFGFR